MIKRMKKLILLSVLLTIVFASPPDWNVNPADYEMSANVTCILQLNFEPTGDGNIIGAFSGAECVGVVTPIFALDNWIYFLTVYSNTADVEVIFKAYIQSEDAVADIQEVIYFAPNAVYGSPTDPYVLNAILGYDFAPVVLDIPDQMIEQGDSFSPFDLDDFLTTQDSDVILWSVSGNTNLSVDIDENAVVTIVPVNPDWIGADTVTFSATDDTENGSSDWDEATFTIVAVDDPPVIGNIPDQTIGFGGTFDSIDLDSFIIESDGDEVAWTYEILPPQETTEPPGWTVNPSEYEMTMTVTAVVESLGEEAEGSGHILAAFTGDECRGVTTAIYALDRWFYFLTVYSNQSDETIIFRFYNADRLIRNPR